MKLINEIMPEYQIRTSYNIMISARPEDVYRSILNSAYITDSLIFQLLIKLRELPTKCLLREDMIFPVEKLTFFDLLEKAPCALLGMENNEEILLGFMGRFWDITNTDMTKATGVEDFLSFSKPGYGKATMNFSLKSVGEKTRLSTETRVFYPEDYVGFFKLYWLFVGPFSGLMRKVFLNNIKNHVEDRYRVD